MKELLYDWGGANAWLFYAINRWHGDALDAVMRLGSFLGDHNRFPGYVAVLTLIALWRITRGDKPRRWLGVLAVFSVAYLLDGLLIDWVKHALDFPRPLAALAPDTVHIVGTPEYRESFPSGHAMFAVTCAASLWPLLGRAGRGAAAAFVLWVAFSRISLGMHFPADVIAAGLLALAIVLSLRLALQKLMRRFNGITPRIRVARPARELSSRRRKRWS